MCDALVVYGGSLNVGGVGNRSQFLGLDPILGKYNVSSAEVVVCLFRFVSSSDGVQDRVKVVHEFSCDF